MRVSDRIGARVLTCVLVTVSSLGGTAASAQGVGFQGGVSVDPEQAYVGSHFESGEIIDRLRFRPSIEGGRGEGFSLATINLEFMYAFPIQGTEWALYETTAPVVAIARFGGDTDVRGGLSAGVGIAHENGFFAEIKVGSYGAPTLKFGTGYTIRFGSP